MSKILNSEEFSKVVFQPGQYKVVYDPATGLSHYNQLVYVGSEVVAEISVESLPLTSNELLGCYEMEWKEIFAIKTK